MVIFAASRTKGLDDHRNAVRVESDAAFCRMIGHVVRGVGVRFASMPIETTSPFGERRYHAPCKSSLWWQGAEGLDCCRIQLPLSLFFLLRPTAPTGVVGLVRTLGEAQNCA